MKKAINIRMLPPFYDVLTNPAREKVLYGGSSSGKSYAVRQYAIVKAMGEPDMQTLCCMETLPAVRVGILMPTMDLLRDLDIPFKENLSVPIHLTLNNGHIIWFIGLDKPENVKQFNNVKRVIIDEATRINKDKIMQLKNRMGRTFGDAEIIYAFNPVDEHNYIVEEFVIPFLKDRKPGQEIATFNGGKTIVFHSTYHDNPYVDAQWIAKTEETISKDKNFYRVYCLGEPGYLEGLVYEEGRNWIHLPADDMPINDSPPARIGVDWGYNNPTAVVAVWEDEHATQAYAHQLIYRTGIIQDDVMRELNIWFGQNQWPRSVPIFCDSAEPARIEDMRRGKMSENIKGFDARPSQKNILFGIGTIKARKLIVSEESREMISELRNYRWDVTPDRLSDKPIDLNNHALDALRYAIATDSRPQRKITMTIRPADTYRSPFKR